MSAPLLARVFVSAALTLAAGPESTATPAAASSSETSTDAAAPVAELGPFATQIVLPCGLRVIAAEDHSLPVASVVLAVEVGTEDDPEDKPGLIHALAFHLQAGNRDLQPGEALANAHDAGGLATMAVGHAQVRFESLVPVSALDRTLWIESIRLRAPTISETLWLKSLNYARSDRRPKYPVPPQVLGESWQRSGLAHDGHVVPRTLSQMLPEAIAAQLTKHFDYRRSTLVIVSPRDPARVIAQVRELFADLPAVPQDLRAAALELEPRDAPRPFESAGQNGDTMVWPVPANPAGRAWAEIVCATLNRQRRGDDDEPKSRLRCTYIDDARRPVMAVRALGVGDPVALVTARLARIEAGQDKALLTAQRDRIRRRLGHNLHSASELARHLAQVEPSQASSNPTSIALSTLSGIAALEAPERLSSHVGPVLEPTRSVLLVRPTKPAKPEADEGSAK